MKSLQRVELVGNDFKKSTKKIFSELNAKLDSDDEDDEELL